MKRFLLLGALALASVAHAQPIDPSGYPPAGYPTHLYVTRVPLGSGAPDDSTPGNVYLKSLVRQAALSSYSRADHVRDGLYQVPGYTPGGDQYYNPPAQVVQLHCQHLGPLAIADVDSGTINEHPWFCDGYAIRTDLGAGSGRNILIQPIFDESK